jgi:GNAT superfamily N-acetyltransferase
VVAIDQALTGQARRRFFEKRFRAAAASADDHVHVGVAQQGGLRGFAMARILRGEFGREDACAVLDAVGVMPEWQKHGIGRALMDRLREILRERGVRSLQSQAKWTDEGLLHFLRAGGFQLAPRLVLERPAAQVFEEASDEL